MKKIILLVAVILILSMLAACGNSASGDDRATDDEPETEEVITLYEIKTDYAVLKYPDKYKDSVDVKIDNGDPYTVTFSSDDVVLFTLGFNGGKGDVIGTIISDSGNTVLRVDQPVLDKSMENYDTYFSMQEDLGYIVTNLSKDYKFVAGEIEDDNVEVYEIECEYATLSYPVKWKDKVDVESVENGVRFSSGGTPLFDILFGSDKGILVGTYDGQEVRVVDYPVKDAELAAMQEDINVILDHLAADEKFVSK